MVVPERKRLFYLSWLTLFGMSAIGILLISYVQEKSVHRALLGGKPYYLQFITGLFFGSLSALLAMLLINGRRFKNVRAFFENLMSEINPSFPEIVFYSCCAAVGEEILFRAGIQPLIGIWFAAIIFVLLHGYINLSNFNLTIYGVFLIAICSGFGYLYKFFGLASSVTAHFVYDLSMFSALKYAYRKASSQS